MVLCPRLFRPLCLLALLPGLLLSTRADAVPSAKPAPRCLQVIGTNDVHGHVEPEVHSAGAFKVEQGGLPGFAGYLNILRAQYPKSVLLLDAGDLFQGTLVSNASHGAAIIQAYNVLGYRASAIGNHEFDFGEEAGTAGPWGALQRRMAEAKFPVLACNLVETATGKAPRWKNLFASRLLTVNGIRVGLIGAMTEQTGSTTSAENVAGLAFVNPAACVARESKRLGAQGAQVKILLAHLGGACSDTTQPTELASCTADSEVFNLLRKLPQGTVDAVVAGHVHQYMAQRFRETAIIESGRYGRAFGWVQTCVEAHGQVTTTLHPPTDICLQTWKEGGCAPRDASEGVLPATFLGEPVAADAAAFEVLAPYFAKVKAQSGEPLGVTLTEALPRVKDRASSLGRLVAEGIRRASPGARIGLSNAGGIRAPLPGGALHFKDIFEALPFDNHVVSLRMKGKDLVRFVRAPLDAGHGFPQLSGATLTVTGAADRLTLDGGAAVEDETEYWLATNDFLASGGDGTQGVLATAEKVERRDEEILVRDAVSAYLKASPQPVVPPKP